MKNIRMLGSVGGVRWRFLRACLLAVFLGVFIIQCTAQVEQYDLTLSVSEDALVGTVVGEVRGPKYSPPYSRLVKNQVTDNKTLSSFHVDLENGRITTKDELNREEREKHTIIIGTSLPTQLIIVEIRVLDVNDVTPTFLNSKITVSIPESAPKTHKIPLGSVTDEDLGENSTQTVNIISGNIDNTFVLQIKTSSNVDKILDLVVNTDHLDYEVRSVYNLVIRASDGGGKYSDMDVTIRILDQNDNEPIFNTSKYSARIAENVTVGTPIILVDATDSDSAENSRITYSIDQKTNPEEHFAINPQSGWVIVKKPLDYETKSRYLLKLVATDSGNSPLTGTAALDITVENINEQPANISLTFEPEFKNGHVLENTPLDTMVAVITVDDPDTETNHLIDVSLYGDKGYFDLRISEEKVIGLHIVQHLDRETVPSYEMTVVATDVGTPPLRANTVFKLFVDDVNDNPPQFLKKEYTADVEETAEIGKEVIQVSASDPDSGDNARITYRIQDGPSHLGWFTVDSNTGILMTRASMDCELSPQPVLSIVATDGGDPPRMATAQVTINVRDVNDKEPEFETSFYSIKVAENRRVGDCILTVSATDPECGANSPVTYKMALTLNPLQEFRVDSQSGEVCVQAALDYERNSDYQFQVEAVDTDGLSTQAVVQVEVTDVNDNHPKFEPVHYPINVVAGVQPGPLVTVQARDRDSGAFGTVTYAILSGNDLDFFSVNTHTGGIFLDHELPSGEHMFTLRVQATDGGGLTSPDPALVIISVISGNIHPPIFSPTMFNFSISEASEIGQLVGQVEATLDSTGGFSEITYSSVFQTEDWFRVDNRTGNIYTKGKLDREQNSFVVVSVQAQAHYPPVYAVAQVNVTITDVNDNHPHFLVTTMLELEVREDESVGTELYVARANDRDTGDNGVVRYRLQNVPGDMFSIHPETGVIKLMEELNYERHKEFQLLVIARDLGSPQSLSSNMTLTVNIKDVNDNPPKFDRDVYNFYVAENVEVGHTIDRVKANDDDSDHNGRVSYSLKDNRYESVFGISPVEGTIWTRDFLDRELHEMYEMVVEAIDHGSPVQLSATATIRIIVTDINDNEPKFSRDEYRFTVQENQIENSWVGQVVAVDLDSGNNGKLQYFFSGSQTNFIINSQNGEIRTHVSLDRELSKEHLLTVYVSDGGEYPKTALTKVKVLVEDVNDNSPIFQRQGPFNQNILENRPKGTEVTTLLTVDPDEGENGMVRYFFDQERSEAVALDNFDIHPRSGKVTTREVLDYETRSVYHLTVVARDGGVEYRETSQLLTISVEDANDQAPLFHAQQVTFTCVENSSVGTVVGVVVATDQDSGDNGQVNYYLVGGNVFSSLTINRSSGVITTVREIDYEEASSHTLSIQAVDSSAAYPRSSNITVTVQVEDVNDNAPVFEQDPVIIQYVAENSRRNHVIHTFIAMDSDSGVNGTVQYSIESYSGEDEGAEPYFDIDAISGQLFVSGSIDYEKVDQISVIVRAEDLCPYPEHRQHSLMTTIVYVTDVNDNPPVFESTDMLVVSEEESIGYMILVVVAVDPDANIDDSGNNVVTYHIVSGNDDGRFQLGEDTGYLTIYDALDYESRISYALNISAQDSGIPKRVSYQLLHINVSDVNDNAPVFQQTLYHANVTENSSPQTYVTTISATDKDTDTNGELRYSIPSGVAEDKFSVDPLTGVVITRVRLDREKKDSYIITAYVQDAAYPVHYSSCSILVTVSDLNDNLPIFKSDSYSIQIPENRGQTAVLSVVASDSDLGENARITYAITDGNDGRFTIGSQDGQLSNQPLDRETFASYNLTITARDHGSNPQTATASVLVTVLDENDNSPIFSKPVYPGSIPENIGQGEVVLEVLANDPDEEGPNSDVMYSLGNDTDGYFEIDSSTGKVFTSGVFDREKVSFYSFFIMASDNGVTGPRNTTARVDITVTDINDNAPVFSLVPYTSSLGLATLKGKLILTVSASDPDLGSNGLVEYSLHESDGSPSSSQYFRVDPTSGKVYSNSALLSAAGHHSLLVVATDSAASPSARLSSTGVIEITVGSTDSNQFQFTKAEYSVQVNEHLGQNLTVAMVTASYSSAGVPSTSTSYDFASGNENLAFSMDSRSGEVKVRDSRLLDYDTNPDIRLIVTATNSGNHAYATLWVHLIDINDNAPKFSQTRYVSAIWENNQPETFVTQVVARDADSGPNGEVDYFIIGGNDENVFVIKRAYTGIIQTDINAAPLDREARPDGYKLVIQARDHGAPETKTSTCVLVITIVDENDTPPFFPNIGPRNVSENRDIGYVVAMATANDVDLKPILVYDFTTDGNPDNTFGLDRSTGRLTLAKRLDHEQKAHYSVGIQVMDGKPDHTRSMWVDVYVSDENDNPPVFSQQSYEVALPEQTGPQQSVVTVLATDADSGQNALITYSMSATSLDSFFIHPTTGIIYTNRTITFTSGESIIQLVVVAKDRGVPVQTSMVAVHIQITDVNKYTPRFLEPTGYEAHVSESALRGYMVLQVSSVDEDNTHRGDNINYTLTGPGSDLFHIRQRTGHIYYNGGLDYEVQTRYDLKAVATDRGSPPKNSSIPVTIFVGDENDNAPEFVKDTYSVTLPEDYLPLKEFIRINATDADSGVNGELRYSITSGNSDGIFLNPRNEGGLVIMEGMHLDYESHTSHRLILRVVDCHRCNQSAPRLSAFVTVDIFVTDVNEFQPSFPLRHYLAEVPENSPINTIVFRAHANDGDGGEAGQLLYGLKNENDYNKFSIDRRTGDVRTRVVFDYENPNATQLYSITINATDSGGNTSEAKVTIQVLDADEYSPLLSAENYNFEVPGSAKAGDYIGHVSASDKDGGEAGRLVFTFLEPSRYFSIHAFSGNITVAVTLHNNVPQAEVESSRKRRALTSDTEDLTIQVSSGRSGSLTDSAHLIISIDRTCVGCTAPVGELRVSESIEGGVLAGIIVGSIFGIIVTIAIILFFVYHRRSPRKSVPNYSSDSTLDLEPPPHLPSDRGYHDVIRISRPPPANHMVSDISDQSHNSASSGRGSAEAEEEDEEISRITSNSYLHSSQAFRQKAMPDSGIQHDDDTLSEPTTAQTHQEYLANLGIDSSKIGKTKSSINNKHLGRSAESMHQFSDEGGGEGGVDTDFEKMTDLETDDEAATLEARSHGMSFHEPDTRNVGSLSNVVNSEEVNSGSYNWDYLIDWGPQYQPLAQVFSEIAKLKDESVTPKKQPIKTVPQRQFSSSLKQPQVRTVPPPIITNAPPMSVPLAGHASNNQNGGSSDFAQQSPPVPVRKNVHQAQSQQQLQQQQQQLHHNHHNHNHHHHHHSHHPVQNSLPPQHPHQHQQQQQQQPIPRASHVPLSGVNSPPAYNKLFPAHLQFANNTSGPLYPHPDSHSPQAPRHRPHHSMNMNNNSNSNHHHHHHHHLPPPQHPPPQPPTQKQQQQQQSSSGSRSQPISGHASTMNTSLPSLPRSPISYESSLTSAAMTPSLTPSLSPLATRSPSISPVVSSGHTTPGKSSSRQNLNKRASATHSVSSSSEKEFTI